MAGKLCLRPAYLKFSVPYSWHLHCRSEGSTAQSRFQSAGAETVSRHHGVRILTEMRA